MPAIKDQMIYLVVTADQDGASLPERKLSDLDRATTVKDIASGQYEDLIQVIECNPVEGICRDVTEDIAWEVSALWSADGEALSGWKQDFIEQTIGIEAAGTFPRAA
jgi:hypothetical protein